MNRTLLILALLFPIICNAQIKTEYLGCGMSLGAIHFNDTYCQTPGIGFDLTIYNVFLGIHSAPAIGSSSTDTGTWDVNKGVTLDVGYQIGIWGRERHQVYITPVVGYAHYEEGIMNGSIYSTSNGYIENRYGVISGSERDEFDFGGILMYDYNDIVKFYAGCTNHQFFLGIGVFMRKSFKELFEPYMGINL